MLKTLNNTTNIIQENVLSMLTTNQTKPIARRMIFKCENTSIKSKKTTTL